MEDFNKLLHQDFKLCNVNKQKVINDLLSDIFSLLLYFDSEKFKNIVEIISINLNINNLINDNYSRIYENISNIFKLKELEVLVGADNTKKIMTIIESYDISKNPNKIIEHNKEILKKLELSENKTSTRNVEPKDNTTNDNTKKDNKVIENYTYKNKSIIYTYNFQNSKKPVTNDNSNNVILEQSNLEYGLFETIKQSLSDNNFTALLKLLHIYILNIITFQEFVLESQYILAKIDKNILITFKQIMENKEYSKLLNNPFDKKHSISNTDNSSNNINPSYREINKEYPNNNISKNNRIAYNNINTNYINAQDNSRYSEENTIKKLLKNTFEENLLKLENEKFEFDVVLNQISLAIKWLNNLKSDDFTVEYKINIINKIKYFNILSLLYKHKSDTVISMLSPSNTQLIDGLINKLLTLKSVIIEAKNKYSESWEDITNKNYYKSLDIKSFCIKYQEKNILHTKIFTDQLTKKNTRIRHIIKDHKSNNNFISAINKEYKHYYDSFRITNKINKFNYTKNNRNYDDIITEEDLSNIKNNSFEDYNYPTFIFNFSNRPILQDCVTIFLTFLYNNKVFFIDKSKTILFFENLFSNYFNVNISNENPLKYKKINLKYLRIFEEIEEINNDNKFKYIEGVKNNLINIKNINNNYNLEKRENYSDSSLFYKANNNNENKENDIIIKKSNKKKSKNKLEFDNISFDSLVNSTKSEILEEKKSKKLKIKCENNSESIFIPFEKDGKNSLFANTNIYLIIKYFYYFYQRLELAIKISQRNNTFNSSSTYDILKNLIYNLIFKNITTDIYDDLTKILFKCDSGYFLNFDKIFNSMLKLLPNEEVIDSILYVNDGDNSLSDDLKLSIINYKLQEINTFKPGKYFSNNSNFDPLKVFRFLFSNNKLIINFVKSTNNSHKIKNLKQIFQANNYHNNRPISKKNRHLIIKNKGIISLKNIFISDGITYLTNNYKSSYKPESFSTEDILLCHNYNNSNNNLKRKNDKHHKKIKLMKVLLEKRINN